MTALTPKVVCFSTADLDAELWTNKQHLMARLAGAGVGVLYIDSLGLRAPGAGAADLSRIARRILRWRPFARPANPGLWRDSPIVVPRHGSAGWRAVNTRLLRLRLQRNRLRLRAAEPMAVWAFNPHAVEIVPAAWPIVYHCVDDLAAFPGIDARSFAVAERAIVRRARVTIASSRPLVKHLQRQGARDVTYWPNPADVEAYMAVPAAMKSGRPVIGFIGAVQTHKLDVELVNRCARLRPDWDFELIGPVGHGLRAQADDRASLHDLPGNVHLLPAVAREVLPDVLARFSVGIIPYRINEYTAGVFPMKLFEYLAAGMPVVSTPLPSLLGEVEHVEFASTAPEFAAAIDRALDGARNRSSSETDERRAYALRHSWTARTVEALVVLASLGVTPAPLDQRNS